MDEAVNITSFIIRFIQTGSPEGAPVCRGSIRHIQSDSECNFSTWPQAVAFIESYFPLSSLFPIPTPQLPNYPLPNP